MAFDVRFRGFSVPQVGDLRNSSLFALLAVALMVEYETLAWTILCCSDDQKFGIVNE